MDDSENQERNLIARTIQQFEERKVSKLELAQNLSDYIPMDLIDFHIGILCHLAEDKDSAIRLAVVEKMKEYNLRGSKELAGALFKLCEDQDTKVKSAARWVTRKLNPAGPEPS